jgi:hypothetical protein
MKPKCCKRIYGGGISFRGRSCSRDGVVERSGSHYCRQHDPVAANEAQERRSAKYQEDFEKSMKLRRLQAAAPDLLGALEVIASGGRGQFQWSLTKAESLAAAAIAKAKGELP